MSKVYVIKYSTKIYCNCCEQEITVTGKSKNEAIGNLITAIQKHGDGYLPSCWEILYDKITNGGIEIIEV